jgi:hypothetical protein
MTPHGTRLPRRCPDLSAQQSVADEAIAAAFDARLIERKSRPVPDVVRPVEGPTEPQLIAVEPRPSRRRLLIRGNP